MINATFSSFITCAYFSSSGASTVITDKLIEALKATYALFNIKIELLVFDADTHNVKTYIKDQYQFIREQCSKHLTLNSFIHFPIQLGLIDDLHILKRCRSFLLQWTMTFSLDDSAIDKWQIVDIRYLQTTDVVLDQASFNENQMYLMSDKAALNLLNLQNNRKHLRSLKPNSKHSVEKTRKQLNLDNS
ncbi:Hypothetical_protein [Hexamita inflata]|uniref:Hypothetical_protein n=1 Tax=Hexamita inflata TaxID=28002 RepID=A0AA86PPZ8_9EUKA|nr:Hypothetical protein HINF_LOCUS30343 [Hexamita inflata]